jgi:hypothetical protein
MTFSLHHDRHRHRRPTTTAATTTTTTAAATTNTTATTTTIVIIIIFSLTPTRPLLPTYSDLPHTPEQATNGKLVARPGDGDVDGYFDGTTLDSEVCRQPVPLLHVLLSLLVMLPLILPPLPLPPPPPTTPPTTTRHFQLFARVVGPWFIACCSCVVLVVFVTVHNDMARVTS